MHPTTGTVPQERSLDPAARAQVESIAIRLAVDAGEVVYRAGQPSNGLFVVVQGMVELEAEATRILLGPGEFFGEEAGQDGDVRLATATAVAASRLMMVGRDDLRVLGLLRPAAPRAMSLPSLATLATALTRW